MSAGGGKEGERKRDLTLSMASDTPKMDGSGGSDGSTQHEIGGSGVSVSQKGKN